jgi:hypothetical protein
MPLYSWQNIARRMQGVKNPVGAEIGVHRGDLSRRLLTAMPDLKLYMIDAWSPDTYAGKGDDAAHADKRKLYEDGCEDNYLAALIVASEFPSRAIVQRGFSKHEVEYFLNESFDFIYIDAAHDYESVKADIMAWLPKVKKGGYICGHDYGVFDGVKKSVDEIFRERVDLDSDFTWWVRV